MYEVKSDPNPPAPNLGEGQAWRQKYPFGGMKVGDYFDVPDAVSKRDKIQNAACKYGQRNEMKFSTRTLEDKTLRVWRTA